MSDNQEKNKQIAKNTILLYFRTFITMVVGLYTGRVMLQALGIEDYGINNVVGGIVAMSGLLSNSLSRSCSRYITYAIGKGDLNNSRNVFSTVVNVQVIMAITVSLVLEIIGIWFLNTTAEIPEGRIYAANWVMHCSIAVCAVGLISVPYNSTIVAHEHMSIYAYMSIVDVVLKLVNCFAILYYGGDKLILFALLGVAESIAIRLFYGWYCSKHFEEAKYKLSLDKSLLREMSGFTGWNMLGTTSAMLNNHGVNMLINTFFGVTYNAARGIANTVNGCVQEFISNFGIAFQPQITKSYAQGNYEYCYSLTNRGTKFTCLMMFIFIVPVCMEADQILGLWLVEVPEYAAIFLRLVMFESLAIQSGHTLVTLIHAEGKVKRYQIEVLFTVGLIFPIVWVLYYLGAPVWTCNVVFISIYITLVNWVKFRAILRSTDFPITRFFRDVLTPCLLVLVVSFSLPLIISIFWEDSICRFFVMTPFSIIWTILVCYVLGLTESERGFLVEKVATLLKTRILKKNE